MCRDYEPPPMPDIMVVLYTTVNPKNSTQVPYIYTFAVYYIEVSLILFIVVIILPISVVYLQHCFIIVVVFVSLSLCVVDQ